MECNRLRSRMKVVQLSPVVLRYLALMIRIRIQLIGLVFILEGRMKRGVVGRRLDLILGRLISPMASQSVKPILFSTNLTFIKMIRSRTDSACNKVLLFNPISKLIIFLPSRNRSSPSIKRGKIQFIMPVLAPKLPIKALSTRNNKIIWIF